MHMRQGGASQAPLSWNQSPAILVLQFDGQRRTARHRTPGLEVRFGQRTILDNLHGSLSGRAIGLLGPNGRRQIHPHQYADGFLSAFPGHRADLRARHPQRSGAASAT